MPAHVDISSIKEIFQIWESLAQMARELGIEYQTVCKWQQRGRIPPESWDAVIAAALKKGKTVSVVELNRVNKPRDTAHQVEVSG